MAKLQDLNDLIKNLIQVEKFTHQQIANYLEREHNIKYCERTIRRYCKKNITKKFISHVELVHAVQEAISEVGPTYGRKMMYGYLKTKGITASQKSIQTALREANGEYHLLRTQNIRNLNPMPYFAEYFGHKLHFDQNEKLIHFGVTHVIAIDGYSRKIVAFQSMPIKNNLIIYEQVMRAAYLKYNRMWNQIRVDHGKKFYLILYMQELNAMKRCNLNRDPFRQTESKRNLRVERIWPEVNNCLNYPLKQALQELVNSDAINMQDQVTRFCVSTLTLHLCQIGLQRIVDSWNAYPIPHAGIPNELERHAPPAPSINEINFPPADIAAEMYSQTGGHLTAFSLFAPNCFQMIEQQQQWEQSFLQLHPNFTLLLNEVNNNYYATFQTAVLDLIRLVNNICSNIY